MKRPDSGLLRVATREFIVVVMGVLVALAAQAWWEGREDSEKERSYLRQLLADTRANEETLNTVIEQEEISVGAARRALGAMRSNADVPADSFMRWVNQAGRSENFRLTVGTYRALVQTGDLRLLRNGKLRSLVVSYESAVESEEERQSQIRGSTFAMVDDLARALPFIQDLFATGKSGGPVDIAALRRNPDVAIVMFTILAANTNRVNGLEAIRDRTSELRAALQEEAEKRRIVEPQGSTTD